jgi:hypothetical protein
MELSSAACRSSLTWVGKTQEGERTTPPHPSEEDSPVSKHRFIAAIAVCAVAPFGISACGDDDESNAANSNRGLPQGSEPSNLDPADFSTNIDNPYWPMAPGNEWVFSETDTKGTKEKVVITVTDKTKMIANGIRARVIRDAATENGIPVEITDDWYAQDKDGNVWYLGESVRNFENGKVADQEGSFEAGVDGADAGVVMPADPVPGLSYRQEYYKGEAEDKGEVITVGEERVEVPAGFFKDVVMTRDLVPLEPKVEELKFFARGVGPVLSMHTDGAGGRGTLISFKKGK